MVDWKTWWYGSLGEMKKWRVERSEAEMGVPSGRHVHGRHTSVSKPSAPVEPETCHILNAGKSLQERDLYSSTNRHQSSRNISKAEEVMHCCVILSKHACTYRILFVKLLCGAVLDIQGTQSLVPFPVALLTFLKQTVCEIRDNRPFVYASYRIKKTYLVTIARLLALSATKRLGKLGSTIITFFQH